MGFNTVAVLFNDMTAEIRESGPLGGRIATAMNTWNRTTGNDGYFHAGRVISRDHADGYQVTVVHANGGKPLNEASDLPAYVLAEMAECLKRHGWRAKRPARIRKLKTPTP